MQITRNSINTTKGSREWFTGDVFVDTSQPVFFDPGEDHWHGAAPTHSHDAHRNVRRRRQGQQRDVGTACHRPGVRGRAIHRGRVAMKEASR